MVTDSPSCRRTLAIERGPLRYTSWRPFYWYVIIESNVDGAGSVTLHTPPYGSDVRIWKTVEKG